MNKLRISSFEFVGAENEPYNHGISLAGVLNTYVAKLFPRSLFLGLTRNTLNPDAMPTKIVRQHPDILCWKPNADTEVGKSGI